ncbi:MAG: hypothetical protein AB8H80_16125 [Planctomycetota bacterium]
MRGVVMLVLVLLICGGVQGLLMRAASPHGLAGPPAVSPGDVHGDSTNRDASGVEAATAEAGTVDEEASGERTMAVAGRGRGSSVPPPPVPADARRFDLRVVDGESGVALADALVRWLGPQQWQELRERAVGQEGADPQASDQDGADLVFGPDRLAAKYGWRTQTDATGIAHLHAPSNGPAFVIASFERDGATFYGQRYVGDIDEAHGSATELYELAVFRDQSLRVRVVDPQGQPVRAVPLQMRLHDGASEAPVHSFEVGRSGDDGILTIAHVQRRRQYPPHANRAGPVVAWSFAAAIPGLDAATAWIDASARPPRDPVELRLPAVGSLVVRVTLNGAPPPGLGDLGLQLSKSGRSAAPTPVGIRPTTMVVEQETPGQWRFLHLPLGERFGVCVRGMTIDVAGPSLPSQEVFAEVRLDDLACVVVGQLLDSDGVPIAEEAIEVAYDLSIMRGSTMVVTDKDGRFEWLLRKKLGGQPGELRKMRFQRGVAGGTFFDVPPRELVVGFNYLGKMRMEQLPLAVAGKFVLSGRATPGRGTGSRGPAPSGSGQLFIVPRVQRFLAGNGQSRDRWQTEAGIQHNIAEDLSFVIYGQLRPGRHRLVLRSQGTLPIAPVEFSVGQRGLRIPVAWGHRATASLLLPSDIAASQVHVRFRPMDGTVSSDLSDPDVQPPYVEPTRRQVEIGGSRPSPGDGGKRVSYRWKSLRAGRYSLTVSLAGGQSLHRVDDVVLPLSSDGDSRLVDIDLRGIYSQLDLFVSCADAGTARGAVAFVLPQPNDGSEWTGASLDGVHTVLPVVGERVDLMVAAPNYRPVTLRSVSGRIEVELEPWPTTDIAFDQEDLPGGVHLGVEIAVASTIDASVSYDSGSSKGSLRSLLEAGASLVPVRAGHARLTMPSASAELRVVLVHDGRTVEMKRFEPRRVKAGQSHRIDLPADELRAALAELLR